jgi:MFS family permease
MGGMTSRPWLNRNVAGMTLTSLFSDACYEMILSVLPGFLAAVGISPAALGWIEGAADALSSFLKLWAGWYSDHIGKRKRIVVAGYFFTGTGMSLFALAAGWPMILLGRMVSWFGKGIRGSLRDAMLSESVAEEYRGRAFGLHRAGDTIGAVIGPLAGIALLHWLPAPTPDHPFRIIFLASLIPGLGAPVAFALLVRETGRRTGSVRLWCTLRELPQPFRRFLIAAGVFGLGDFSPTLLVMAAAVSLTPTHGKVGAASIAAALYLVRNVTEAVTAYPIGASSDRVRRTSLLAAGYSLAAASAVAAVYAEGAHRLPAWVAVFVVAGVFAAAKDTLESAIPASMITERIRGTAYGALGFVNGFGDLAASALVGTLWWAVSPAVAFSLAATIMGIGTILMMRVVDARRPNV